MGRVDGKVALITGGARGMGAQAVVDEMIRSGKGSIINISSIEGLRGEPFAHAYVASKWAVRG